MKNYKLTIAYDGTRYHGWEAKRDVDTIQGRIENVLSRMVETEVRINGAGRTDAGVHAKAMVANGAFHTSLTENEIRDYMNAYLPDDICITQVKEARERFHARFKAQGKHYRYTLYKGNTKPVFDRKFVWVLSQNVNVSAMKEAAAHMVGEQDFRSFLGNKHFKKSTVKTIHEIKVTEKGDYIYLDFSGSGFLQNQVRIMTGTLVDVGTGRFAPGDIPEIIEAKDRQRAGQCAPACGLCLEEVFY